MKTSKTIAHSKDKVFEIEIQKQEKSQILAFLLIIKKKSDFRLLFSFDSIILDKNISRLCTFLRSDNSSFLQYIHNPRCSSKSNIELSLKKGCRSFSRLSNYLNCLINKIFIISSISSTRKHSSSSLDLTL